MKHRQFIQSTTAFGRKVDEFIRNPAIKDHPLRQVSKHVWMEWHLLKLFGMPIFSDIIARDRSRLGE